MSFETLWEKKKLLVTSNFFFYHSVFYPFKKFSAIFFKYEIAVCKLFQFGRVHNLLFGEGLNMDHQLELLVNSRTHVYSLPNEKILDWSKLKAFADDKSKVANIMIFVFDSVENIVGKRKKCWLPAFSSFPTMFSKAFFLRVVKSRDCAVRS